MCLKFYLEFEVLKVYFNFAFYANSFLSVRICHIER